MAPKILGYLSIALSMQVAFSAVAARSIKLRDTSCQDGFCQVDSLASDAKGVQVEQRLKANAFNPRDFAKRELKDEVQLHTIRAVPVVVPKPDVGPDATPEGPRVNDPDAPKKPTENPFDVNDPQSQPKTTPDKPANNPTTPKDPTESPSGDTNDATDSNVCSSGFRLGKRCPGGDSGDDSDEAGGVGEAPEGVTDPSTQSETSGSQQPQEEEDIDYFEVANNDIPPPNPARDFFRDQVDNNRPDQDIPDPTTIDPLYEFESQGAKQVRIHLAEKGVDGIRGREQFGRAFERLGIEHSFTGTLVSATSRAPGTTSAYHDSVWTDDGKIVFAEFSFRDEDKTPSAQRMPWYKTMMYIRKHVLPGDASQLVAICRQEIDNASTKLTIDSIMASQLPKNEDGDVVVSANSQDALERAAFDGLTRTNNGKGQFWLTGAYHNEFHGNGVTAIVVQNKPDYGLIFVLGPPAK